MRNNKTSQSHPLQIAAVTLPQHGRIGITFCPGKKDPFAATGAWHRDLDVDIMAIKDWGALTVLTLMQTNELNDLKVSHLGDTVCQHAMHWLHLPIEDFSVPNAHFEQRWQQVGAQLRAQLRQGQDIVIHCKGGLGRAGMIAARLLVELGMDNLSAIRSVRRARRGAIETSAQLALVKACRSIPDGDNQHE